VDGLEPRVWELEKKEEDSEEAEQTTELRGMDHRCTASLSDPRLLDTPIMVPGFCHGRITENAFDVHA
jgi:hypothetical protein